MSTISAGTTSGTALVSAGNTDGTLQLRINGTTPSVTLAANGSIGVGSSPSYGNSGEVLTSAGTGSAPTWVAASSLAAATQAQMEAASSNTVAATPSNTQYHPGVANAWLKCDAAGAIQVSHNITSITDDGTGLVTVTIATDFSSAEYAILLTAQAAQGNQRTLQVSNNTIPTAGAFTLISFNNGGTLFDATHYFAACFGDQA